MLVLLDRGHTAAAVAGALSDAMTTLPAQRRRSLTGDQGKEMAEHARFSVATNVPVYFCDPHSPCSAAPMRIPTGCCAGISPAAPTSRRLRRVTSTMWPPS